MTALPSRHELEDRYRNAGQHHVFEHYDEWTECERQGLLDQLRSLPPIDDLRGTFAAATSGLVGVGPSSPSPPPPPPSKGPTIEPYRGEIYRLPHLRAGAERGASASGASANDDDTTASRDDNYRRRGMHALSRGQVAAVVMAGGQGTRLGFDGPKGLYDIGLPSQMSLFELQARRIAKLQELAEAETRSDASSDGSPPAASPPSSTPVIPFYIMTSPLNHDATIRHFEEHDYFGLSSCNVFFFQQGMLPCLDLKGKIIMEARGRVAMAPNGNGGIYPSLQQSGALDDMTRRGVICMNVFSVDNALIRPADPVFVGYCLEQGADVGNKVVAKLHPHEKVGVLAMKDGRPGVVEYSEITSDMAEQQVVDEVGGGGAAQLAFGAANIANHYFAVEFVRDKVLGGAQNLYHAAHKKIPYWDNVQQLTVTPVAAPNGIKLEAFIFDAFALSQNMAVLQVHREDEFAPVKNATGVDSPASARQLLSRQAQRWIVEAGGTLTNKATATTAWTTSTGATSDEDDVDQGLTLLCEISPTTSYAGEGLERIVQERGGLIECPFVL